MSCRFWRQYSPEELEREMAERPITIEDLYYLTKKTQTSLSLSNWAVNRGSIALTLHVCHFPCINHIPRYSILLNERRSFSEQMEDFAHEVTHIFYSARCTSTNPHGDVIEELIDRESLVALGKFEGAFKQLGNAWLDKENS